MYLIICTYLEKCAITPTEKQFKAKASAVKENYI